MPPLSWKLLELGLMLHALLQVLEKVSSGLQSDIPF